MARTIQITQINEGEERKISHQNNADFFFDCEGIIHKEFLPEGSTLNAAAYVEVLKRLLQRIRWVRLQYMYSEPEAT